jgi:hypothetical protein
MRHVLLYDSFGTIITLTHRQLHRYHVQGMRTHSAGATNGWVKDAAPTMCAVR